MNIYVINYYLCTIKFVDVFERLSKTGGQNPASPQAFAIEANPSL